MNGPFRFPPNSIDVPATERLCAAISRQFRKLGVTERDGAQMYVAFDGDIAPEWNVPYQVYGVQGYKDEPTAIDATLSFLESVTPAGSIFLWRRKPEVTTDGSVAVYFRWAVVTPEVDDRNRIGMRFDVSSDGVTIRRSDDRMAVEDNLIHPIPTADFLRIMRTQLDRIEREARS